MPGKKSQARRPGRRGRSQRKAASSRVLWWLPVALLAFGVLVLGAHLYRTLPGGDGSHPLARHGAVRERLEALLGPFDSSGARVRVASDEDASSLVRKLSDALRQGQGAKFQLEPWVHTSQSLAGAVVVDGRRIPLRIEWSPYPAVGAMLAVVIDDMGRNVELERQFLELPFPVTPSLLPHLRHTKDVAELARGQGREYLLHLPMEPHGYPAPDPGQGAVLVSMQEQDVRAAVRDLLQAVPGASGANNHMGSRFTEREEMMGWVLDELRDAGLFFLDSVTSSATVGWQVARNKEMGWARRDVFLDNDREVDAVGAQLDRAMQLAQQRGSAVAIGHPHRVTLEVLGTWAPRFAEAGIRVVPLRSLLQHGDGA